MKLNKILDGIIRDAEQALATLPVGTPEHVVTSRTLAAAMRLRHPRKTPITDVTMLEDSLLLSHVLMRRIREAPEGFDFEQARLLIDQS